MNDAPGRFDKTRVTYHAVTRYVQRILGFDVDGTETFKTEKDRALAHAAAAGSNIDHIRDLIWTPGVETAVKLGFATVTVGDLVVRINRQNAVIATVHQRKEAPHRKLKMLTRREIQARSKQIERRMKRKPLHFKTEIDNEPDGP